VRRIPLRVRFVTAVVAVVALVAGLTYVGVTSGTPQMTVTAEFATSPGLYSGNEVKILGMPVGHVIKITTGPTYVTVVLHIPASTKVPANAQAVIMAPNIVNDRYVQLNPAYTGGPTLPDHAVIPVSRTGVPVSVDDIIDSLDQLAVALGPKGANANGAFSGLIASAAKAFGGNGAALNSTITNLGGAFGALSSQGSDLTSLFDNLGNLSHVASQFTSTYQAFAADLAVVSTDLASDDSSLGSALANLQQALGALATFIHDNGAALGSSVTNLSTFAGAVAKQQASLEQVFGVLPVALQNLDNAFDPVTHALKARFDPESGSAGFSNQVCGNPLLRLLIVALDPSQDAKVNPELPSIDLACGVNGLLGALPNPPGATAGPDLSLAALVGGGA
jgi:phospholipid/cholesterol/gamma-HCH transport system substrate-binding protein